MPTTMSAADRIVGASHASSLRVWSRLRGESWPASAGGHSSWEHRDLEAPTLTLRKQICKADILPTQQCAADYCVGTISLRASPAATLGTDVKPVPDDSPVIPMVVPGDLLPTERSAADSFGGATSQLRSPVFSLEPTRQLPTGWCPATRPMLVQSMVVPRVLVCLERGVRRTHIPNETHNLRTTMRSVPGLGPG